MAENNTILVVAVLAVIASLAAAGFSYYSMNQSPKISGFATTDTGSASVTITSTMDINFTDDTVNFGAGRVNPLTSGATLNTENSVTGGNWTPIADGFTLQNIGNVNVTLTLQSGANAAELLGGTNPTYSLKVTNKETGSCTITGFSAYALVDKTKQATCSNFGYLDAANEIDIDVELFVPYNSILGARSDTITAEATAA